MQTAYFQDKISGQTVKFTEPWDIKEMKNHPEYQEITEKEFKAITEPKKVKE